MRRLGLLVIALGAATSATAQTQAQQDRLDRIAKLGVNLPMCERLGMKLSSDMGPKIAVAVKAETANWSVDPATVARLQSEALRREGRLLASDLDAAAGHAKTDAQLRGVRSILLDYGRLCMEALSDPIYSGLVSAPVGFELGKAATELADTMLEGGGLASWQTPEIQARGDMMMVAGGCRKRIGGARSDALRAEFGKADDPRAREYYTRTFDNALNDPELEFSAAQCDGLISKYRAAIGRYRSR
jgi:hypothetical protein